MKTFELLKELTETPGPSGFENRVSDLVEKTWGPLVDEVAVDRVGSLVALKKGSGSEPRSRIMLAAHMDEIGLMVTKMESYPDTGSGFLRVTSVGGIDKRQLLGQKVIVHGTVNGRHDLAGVLGSLPSRMLPEDRRDRSIGFADLVVDLGLSLEQIKDAVSIGDFISFRRPLRKLLNKRAAGKALDNRVSVVVLTKCLEMLGKRSHSWDVLAVATAQEETALLGAHTSAFDLEPDVAIAVDVTWAKGPGVTEDTSYNLGGGPTIGIGPNVHPGVFKALRDAADRIEIEAHVEPHARMSGTDASGLQMARQGIPTGLVSVPIRYMHMSVETVSLIDIKRASRLITEFIVDLDDVFLTKIQDTLMGK
jgi:putative aminopeptidase FrvX